MVLNAEKRNKLAELVARRKAALDDAGTSTFLLLLMLLLKTHLDQPPLITDRRGWWWQLARKTRTPAWASSLRNKGWTMSWHHHSAFDDYASSFRDNPPSASSPHNLIIHESGGESAPEGSQVPPAVELLTILQQALKCFQNKEAMENLGEDSLQNRVAQSLGKFLVIFILSMSKVWDSEAKLREELALQDKIFSKRKVALNQELTSLRQSEKETDHVD